MQFRPTTYLGLRKTINKTFPAVTWFSIFVCTCTYAKYLIPTRTFASREGKAQSTGICGLGNSRASVVFNFIYLGTLQFREHTSYRSRGWIRNVWIRDWLTVWMWRREGRVSLSYAQGEKWNRRWYENRCFSLLSVALPLPNSSFYEQLSCRSEQTTGNPFKHIICWVMTLLKSYELITTTFLIINKRQGSNSFLYIFNFEWFLRLVQLQNVSVRHLIHWTGK